MCSHTKKNIDANFIEGDCHIKLWLLIIILRFILGAQLIVTCNLELEIETSNCNFSEVQDAIKFF